MNHPISRTTSGSFRPTARKRLHRLRAAAGVALLVLGAAATARAASGVDGKDAPPDPAGAVARDAVDRTALARTACDALHGITARRRSKCCHVPEPSGLSELCARELDAALRRGTVAVDEAAVDRCAEAAERQFAGCDWVRPTAVDLPEECHALTRGTLAAGRACFSSLECEAGLHCRGAGPEQPGRCAPPAAPGARCAAPADRLAAVLGGSSAEHRECDGICVKGRCLPRAGEGEACSSSSLCQAGLQCIAGRCASRPAPRVGESCPDRTACAAGAVCRAGTCVPLKEAGEPCALPFECASLACRKAPGAATGTCADRCGPTGRLAASSR